MKKLILFLFFSCISLQAQQQINGIVKDLYSKKVLPFATILLDNNETVIADVDGKFEFSTDKKVNYITVEYIGYVSKTIFLNSKKYYTVFLDIKTDNLKTVIISNSNAANELIQKVIQNKDLNNPQKKLNYFQFDTYNKLIVTANPDSIQGKIDSIYVTNENGKELKKIDSSEYKFKKIIDKQHLFLAEKVSKFQYAKPILKEIILGSKMAGFKEPIYEFFGFKLLSFSIYEDKYELFETKYKSPISDKAFLDYNFKITDTTKIENRETIIVYFKNKKKKKGLEGLLYIDSENFAIAKAIMRVRSVIDITGIHEMNYFLEEKLWFPIKKTFKIKKGRSNEKISFFGGRIVFEPDSDDIEKNKKSTNFTYLSSETYIGNIELNTPIDIKRSFVKVSVYDSASSRPETFWDKNRRMPIEQRGIETYKILDSIAEKNKLDKKIFFGRKIINGYVPVSFFYIDLRHLISYNNFEGFRIGFGGITNEKLSKIFKIDGYTAYGLKDETIKYSIGAATRIGKFSSTWLGFSYTDDIREIASTNFAIDKRVFKLYDPRPINISTFYNYKMWRGYIETKIIPKTESIWQLNYSDITPLFDYTFVYNNINYNRFEMATAGLSIQWNPFSDFMQSPNGRLEIEKRFPKFTFQFTNSLPSFFDNDFNFGKIDFRVDFEKKYLNGQKSAFLSQAGYAFGTVPITHLYNTSPNNLTKDNLLQRITIAGKNSFETMFFNEFFSNKYVFFQFKHGFRRIELLKKVKPEFVLVTRMAWGDLTNPERHLGIDFKRLNEGFFESGIELNQIFKGFGLSGFYRYGPNQLSRLEDNLAIKLSFILDLGL